MASLLPLALLVGLIRLAYLHRKRRPVQRNLDAFMDRRGVVHPIAGTQGYSERRLEWRERERKDYGLTSKQQQRGRRDKDYDRAILGRRKLDRLKQEYKLLRDDLTNQPTWGLTGLIGKSGGQKGEVGLIPYGQARGIFEKMLGQSPEQFPTSTVKRGGRKYLMWEYVLDELAENLGYDGSDELRDAIHETAREKKHLATMRGEMTRLQGEVRTAQVAMLEKAKAARVRHKPKAR